MSEAFKYDAVVVIGRFQPLHTAHLEIFRRAATLAPKVIVVVGSAHKPRSYKNPFNIDERNRMIQSAIDSCCGNATHFFIESNVDTVYNDDAWIGRIQNLVKKHAGENEKVAIIGHEKDSSSFYLRVFPQWSFEEVGVIEPLNATNIRELYFNSSCNMNYLKCVVPDTTFKFLEKFKESEEYAQIVREREFIEKYKQAYASLPYAPIFVTADAVVVQSGHILMVKRRSEPGKGLWALPGGFVDAKTDKSVVDAAIRELYEETGIKVPEKIVRKSIESSKVFDAIDRSERGRTITHALKIVLDNDKPLPKLKGDKEETSLVKWISISDISSMSDKIFDDHFEIIRYFIS